MNAFLSPVRVGVAVTLYKWFSTMVYRVNKVPSKMVGLGTNMLLFRHDMFRNCTLDCLLIGATETRRAARLRLISS